MTPAQIDWLVSPNPRSLVVLVSLVGVVLVLQSRLEPRLRDRYRRRHGGGGLSWLVSVGLATGVGYLAFLTLWARGYDWTFVVVLVFLGQILEGALTVRIVVRILLFRAALRAHWPPTSRDRLRRTIRDSPGDIGGNLLKLAALFVVAVVGTAVVVWTLLIEPGTAGDADQVIRVWTIETLTASYVSLAWDYRSVADRTGEVGFWGYVAWITGAGLYPFPDLRAPIPASPLPDRVPLLDLAAFAIGQVGYWIGLLLTGYLLVRQFRRASA